MKSKILIFIIGLFVGVIIATAAPLKIDMLTSLFNGVFRYKIFCDLYGVRSCALSDVIRHYPNVATVFNGFVQSDPADVDFVRVFRIDGHRVFKVCGVVNNDQTGHSRQSFFDTFYGAGTFEFDIDRFRVSVENGNSDGGSGNAQIGFFQDLSGFLYHLFLFLCVPVRQEDVDMRQYVAFDRIGELCRRSVFQIVISGNACAGNGLISGINYAFDAEGVVQRL